MVITNDSLVSNWPFPSECPPKPWTPEQHKKYNDEQRQQQPDAPMMQKCL